MQLDATTLSIVTVFVTALLGALLVFAGVQNRTIRAPMWWGAAYIIAASGFALVGLRNRIPDLLSIDIGNALILFGFGLIWAGARVFAGHRVRISVLLLAPVAWIVLCRLPVFQGDVNLRVIVGSTMLACLTTLAAEEFWRGRAEPLMSRWPTVLALLGYAAVVLVRVPVTILSPHLDSTSFVTGVSFALLAFGTLLFTVVLAFLLLNMIKERTELKHKINAMIDPLCGVPNRRAFLDGALGLQQQQALDLRPLAMLLFDLDRFKQLNDRFGHALGDRALQVFARSATTTLGADVLFGRIGGEEFAAFVAVGDLDEGFAIADRVRRKFALAADDLGDRSLRPTVSVGVTLGRGPDIPVDELLARADRGLYRAKELGRNRVEVADAAEAPPLVPAAPGDKSAATAA